MTEDAMRDIAEDEAMIGGEPGTESTGEASFDGETKADKFKRLAAPRVNKVLRTLDQIGNLSNRSSYEYTEEEVDKMFSAMRAKINATYEKFHKGEKKSDGFSF